MGYRPVTFLICCCGTVLYSILSGGLYTIEFLVRVDDDTSSTRQFHAKTKQAASQLLETLLHEDSLAFETKFSTRESVLSNGFPFQWNPCTLHPHITATINNSANDKDDDMQQTYNNDNGTQQQQHYRQTPEKSPPSDQPKPLQIVVLGGSSSAHSAKNCSTKELLLNDDADADAAADPFAGRYSNVLFQDLYHDFFLGHLPLEFEVVNMAQGATDSVWNALVLDELINVEGTADVLVWEFGINDALGGSTKHPFRKPHHLAQMLNIWMWRVYSLFKTVKRNPPPLILMYLWDANFYDSDLNVNTEHLLQHGVGRHSWDAQQQVIQHYHDLGWSISVVHVGNIINNTAVAHNPGVLLDDKHHPNCDTMHLISAMLRHVIYADLANCPAPPPVTSEEGSVLSLVPMRVPGEKNPLEQLLLEDNIKVGSIMQWEPNLGSSSLDLKGEEGEGVLIEEYVKADYGTKTYPWRADRKQSFILPRCGETDAVHFTLLEPSLEWLGIGHHIIPHPIITTVIHVIINDIPIELRHDAHLRNSTLECDEVQMIKDWIEVAEHNSLGAPEYKLSFCYETTLERSATDLQSSDVLKQCPYEMATNQEEVCSIWRQDNFDPTATCPFATAMEACFAWFDQHLNRLGEAAGISSTKSSQTDTEFLPPQLNWIVGVART